MTEVQTTTVQTSELAHLFFHPVRVNGKTGALPSSSLVHPELDSYHRSHDLKLRKAKD